MKRKPKTWQSVKIYLLAGQLISTSHISCCQEFKLPPVFGFISHAWTLDSQIILTSLVTNSYLGITLEKFWKRSKITPKYDFLMSLTRGERESERGQLLISQETKCGQIHFSWPEIFSRNWPSNSKAKEIDNFGNFEHNSGPWWLFCLEMAWIKHFAAFLSLSSNNMSHKVNSERGSSLLRR